jgi:hypothetical protein
MYEQGSDHPRDVEAWGASPADFERALGHAKWCAIVYCTWLNGQVLDALQEVAPAAPNPPRRLVDAAHAVVDLRRAYGQGEVVLCHSYRDREGAAADE